MQLRLTDRWPDPPRDEPTHHVALPGQPDRAFLLPLVHQILSCPDAPWEFPRLSPATSENNARAYWDAALYCVRYLLGWSDAGAGLRWWCERGYDETLSPVLEFLRHAHCASGLMDTFALWAWQERWSPESRPRDRSLESFRGPRWLSDYRARFPTPNTNMPIRYPGEAGTNPMHLGRARPDVDEADGHLVLGTRAEREAVVLSNAASSWYTTLVALGKQLPDLGEHSWHVDVVAKPLGWIGTFRLSRTTGRWFVGKHSIHMAGNSASKR